MTTSFRRSAHRRFTRDIPRGHLLLQLAIVADRDAERIGCPDDRQPARWHLLSAEEEAEYRRLRALCSELVAEAGRLGVTGWIDAALAPARAAARPLIEAGDHREHLVWQVACALEEGAILVAPMCSVGPLCLATGSKRPAYAVYRDPGGVLVNGGATSAEGAAAAFVGERGAGVEAARAALESWERKRREEAA